MNTVLSFTRSSTGALVVSFVFLAALILWPVRSNSTVIEPASDKPAAANLTAENTAYTFSLPVATNVSGIVIPTSDGFHPNDEARLHVRLLTADGREVRAITEPFSDVLNLRQSTVRLTWPTLRLPEQRITIEMNVERLAQEQRFPLRAAHEDFALPDTPVALTVLVTRPLISAAADNIFSYDTNGEDISYYHHRGGEVAGGLNPYSCTRDDTCLEKKNPGHLPLFYQVSALTQQAGYKEYDAWIALWQPIFLIAWAAIGFTLFLTLHLAGQTVLGFFATLFWLFGRWSLYVARVAHIDFVAVLFVVLAAVLWRRVWWLSLILLSLSLATKQVAIFLVPLFLIASWQRTHSNRWRNVLIACVLILAIPLLSVSPFVVDDAEGVIKGLLFSATREPGADLGAPSIDAAAGIRGMGSIAIMLVVMGALYVGAWRYRLPLVVSSMLVFASFLAFNSVIFNQYFVWLMPFIPLAIGEYVAASRHTTGDTKQASDEA